MSTDPAERAVRSVLDSPVLDSPVLDSPALDPSVLDRCVLDSDRAVTADG
jgi:hypothetical protein